MVVKLCKERIPSAFGMHPLRDVQVLSPMHRGAAGTEGLNRALQEALNPAGAAVEVGGAQGRSLRVGDKVMQVRNDYDRDVFNGDVGVIVGARRDEDDEAIVEVDFDGRRVRYEADALGELELAYAVTVHKSQGSEYSAVVIPLLMQPLPALAAEPALHGGDARQAPRGAGRLRARDPACRRRGGGVGAPHRPAGAARR